LGIRYSKVLEDVLELSHVTTLSHYLGVIHCDILYLDLLSIKHILGTIVFWKVGSGLGQGYQVLKIFLKISKFIYKGVLLNLVLLVPLALLLLVRLILSVHFTDYLKRRLII
jgi:hypothetical protein